jgi:hypothetical protein
MANLNQHCGREIGARRSQRNKEENKWAINNKKIIIILK